MATPYQLFIKAEIPRLRQNYPNLSNMRYMQMAADNWKKLKAEENIQTQPVTEEKSFKIISCEWGDKKSESDTETESESDEKPKSKIANKKVSMTYKSESKTASESESETESDEKPKPKQMPKKKGYTPYQSFVME